MTKTLTFKSLALALMLVFGFQSAFAQVFWSETFSDEASATTNWVSGGTNDGPLSWAWTDVVNAGAWQPGNFASPTAADGYMWFDSDANGDFAHDVTLTGTGNPANATGKSDVHLRFYTLFRIFSAIYDGQVGISTDGTNFTYHTVPEFQGLDGASAQTDRYEGWVDIAVPEADGQAQVWVQFKWAGQFEYYWKIDDVELYEYVAPTPSVTLKVDMSQETVDPAGVFIAGTLTGLSAVAMTDEGNGVWSYTTAVPSGTYLYRFLNGPTGFESGVDLVDCGVANGTLGGYDRTLTVGTEDVDLPAVCFNSCDACSGVVSCNDNPNKIICDDFETYTVGNVSPQAAHWIPWDLNDAAGNAVGAEVSTTYASNGTKSMKVIQDDDQLLKLGNKTAGRYSLKWKYYIPTGKAGYFNIQGNENSPGAVFANEVYFRATGVVDMVAPAPTVSGTYPQGEWFTVELLMDLDNNLAKMFVDGALLRAWGYTQDFGAIDYYGADATYEAYVDEVEYIQLPSITYNVDICGSAVDLTQYFGQPTNTPQTTGLYDNTDATTSPTDPTITCWNEEVSGTTDVVNGSMWYTFTGDGGLYHIETVECNATNYIGTEQQDPGDTQMAIFTGDDCSDLTQVACNDDLFSTGDPDWRSGLDLQTESGQTYYMLIDGFEFQGTLALGEFCVQITQVPTVDCGDIAVGDAGGDGFVCFNGVTAPTLDEDGTVIPNVGPLYGVLWAISSAPITDPSANPADDPSYLGSFGLSTAPYVPGVTNNNSTFMTAGSIYYFTPVVIGGATNTSGQGNFLHFLDISGGCFTVGTSVEQAFLPELNDLSIDNFDVTSGAVDISVSGGIAEFLGDPSLYEYSWSGPGNYSATTEDVSDLPAAGDYTVVISDPSGCVDSYTQTFTVTEVSVDDPASVKSLIVSPNPTRNSVVLNLSLQQAAEVRIDVVNTIGQVMHTIHAGHVNTLSQPINLNDLSNGTYFLRVSIDGEMTQRGVVLQR